MAPRRWLLGQHCLWPPLHRDWHEKGNNPIHGKEDFWVCRYCTKYVHERFTIEGIDPEDPTRFWAINKATGKLHKLHGRERLKAKLLAPGELPR